MNRSALLLGGGVAAATLAVSLATVAGGHAAPPAAASAAPTPSPASGAPKSVYDFTVESIDGKPVRLSDYKGKVLLIVNTASLCGNTRQYASLETLYEKDKGKGLRILAFPSNDFAHQEPGSNGEIKEFCTGKYKTTFDLFSKIDVKGDGQAPLYKFLTSKDTNPKFGGDVEWNFAKFLVGRDGTIVGRFPAGTDPLKPEVAEKIEAALKG